MALLTTAALAALGGQVPAEAASTASKATTHSPAFTSACPPAKQGQFTCFALHSTSSERRMGVLPAGTTVPGFGPADLQSAYNLPADGGAGQTVAIVDANDDPGAEADLAVYRSQFGLPACTSANGCFTKVDQSGGTTYPPADPGWAGEISLDLDMVSAIAPNAHILLVEANDASMDNLGASVDEAVALGAKYVSNSYGSNYSSGSGEDPAETTAFDPYYNHPGVAVVASSGDSGYGVSYPAASRYVTSVGGTSLVRDSSSSRGWTESAWGGAGSGCSLYEPKPAFQHDSGCADRAVADVSAVADPSTGVAVYQTYGGNGWAQYGGTSVSSPIIASVYADAGSPVAGSYPNAFPYAATSGLNDVTSGSNGSCSTSYLCNGATGYDGPTGLGTPNGLSAFRSGPHGQVSGTITDTSTGKPISGATITAGGNVAHTGTTGTYTLSVPVGTYDVTVDAFGYASKSDQGVTVQDGAALTEDFALSSVPSQTVSGTVTDGSGHGWPLYAQITVDGAPSSVWTNPTTGAYSLALPEGRAYTVHVAAHNSGYHPVTDQITVGTSAQSLNVQVPADAWGPVPAGYQLNVNGTTESFDSLTTPPGWTVTNASGTNGGWAFDNPGGRTNNTGGSGGFAIVDSDYYGQAVAQDSQLISPVYDFTGKTSPEVAFSTDYQGYSNQTAAVDVTSDGGTTWSQVWSTSTQNSFSQARIELPLDVVANKPAVQVRFHFTGSWGYWWAIDDVMIGSRDLTPTPGGLVVGTVKDANTGAGMVGATVTNADNPAETATTIATPDDPNLGGGYYSIFSGSPGSHQFKAAATHYADNTDSVNVTADTAVDADFSLKAGQLKVTPAKISASVPWGGSSAQKLTITNTGGAPATVKLGENQGGFQPQAAGAPLQKVQGNYPPMSDWAIKAENPGQATAPTPTAGTSDSAWQSAPDLPQAVKDNAVDAYQGKVYSAFGWNGTSDTSALYMLDPAVGSWSQLANAPDARESAAHGFINGKLYVASGWNASGTTSTLDIYDPASNSWTTGAAAPTAVGASGSAVLDGKLYTIGGCSDTCDGTPSASAYDPSANSWTSIAPYPQPVSFEACAGIDHKIYCAGGLSAGVEVAHTYVYDPTANSWSQAADLPTSLWGSEYAEANGQLLVVSGISNNNLTNQGFAFNPLAGSWSALPNTNVPTTRGGAALGFYTIGGVNQPGGAPLTSVELLPGYNQATSDVSWMSESTQQVTLAPGASTTINVSLNASVAAINQPGEYTAQLVLVSDTPYALPSLPVSLQVAPPKSWGKITGTVLGVTATGGTAPLAGATVQLIGHVATYSLTTANDGSYVLWLDTSNNPVTAIVAKDGYQPTVTTVKLRKGATVTGNFTLQRK